MAKRAQEILLWTLLGSLIGAIITIINLELNEITGFWMGVSVIIWLICGLTTAYLVQWLTTEDKKPPYRTAVVLMGLIAPLFTVLAIFIILVGGIIALAEKAGRVSKQ